MGLSRFAVKRPVTITILVSVLIILGMVSLSSLAVDLYPDMKFPVAAVITSYNGAGPEEIESQLSEPIEEILGTITNVKEIQSISLAGSSIVIVMFNWGTDMDFASLNMREKLAIIEKYLPDDADAPMVVKMDPSMMPVLQIGMSGGRDLSQLQTLAEDKVKPRLERIEGVASVTLTGGMTREVKVDVDPVKLQNYGLSMSQIINVLRTDNFNQAGGIVNSGKREYFVRSLQQFENVNEIRNEIITTPSGVNIKLADIAEITDGYKDVTQLTRMDQAPSIGVHILKQSDANSVKVSRAVKEELAALQKELPGQIKVGVVFDQADFINQSIGSIQNSMLEGALLAMVIIYLFLRSVPSTLVIATSIPLSIVATFVMMYFSNMTMNLVSMGGIALGIGRMVDDSIVVLESIFRHRQSSESPIKAAITGAGEVGNAVMAATFTTVAVFLPIVFVEGLAAILFKPLAMAVSFAILSSLIVALTIVPLLTSRMLTESIAHEGKGEGTGVKRLANRFTAFIDGLGEWYRGVINWSLSHRKTVVISVTLMMLASFGLLGLGLVGAEFIPKMDAGQIGINVEMDKGTILSETDLVAKRVEKIARSFKETKTVFTSVGPSGNMMIDTGASQGDTATLKVMLVKKSERNRSTTEIADLLRDKVSVIPGAKITVTEVDPMSEGMGSQKAIDIRIKGDDMVTLKTLSSQVLEAVRKVPGTREASSSLSEGKSEVQIDVDREKAARFGLTPAMVAGSIQSSIQGTVATQYRVGGDEVDVRVRYVPHARSDLDNLAQVAIPSPMGLQIPLEQIADFNMSTSPMSITRYDQVRTADVTCDLVGLSTSEATTLITEKLKTVPFPNGYSYEFVGQAKDMMESFISLFYALLLAIVLVYAVMAIQYESFFIPFVIMFSVPTCFIGAVVGLAVTHRSFSIPAFIGCIMLVGIAVSNAIVLVDYIKTLRERGMERNEAIAEAGAVRLRPVLMTALATILALVPLALGMGEGGESQAPLATVVIGGLLASTAITLVLVPVVYTVFDDWGTKISRRFKKNGVTDGLVDITEQGAEI
ncbi:MAG: efflux RND transporter permease subunit [Candidatus Saccharibacteria bacterium]